MEKHDWSKFFSSSGADIWTIIEQAVTIAALEFPHELRIRRDGITERLYVPPHAWSCKNGSSGEERPKENQSAPISNENPARVKREREDDKGGQQWAEQTIRAATGKVNELDEWEDLSLPDRDVDGKDEAEVLAEEIEKEEEVRKEILQHQSTIATSSLTEDELLEVLEKLEQLPISVQVLQTTDVGKQVNQLRKHSSKAVRGASKQLVKGWKEMVDEWMKSAAAVARADRREGEISEEGSLPSPPMDEEVLLNDNQDTVSLEMNALLRNLDMLEDEICSDMSGGSDEAPQAPKRRRINATEYAIKRSGKEDPAGGPRASGRPGEGRMEGRREERRHHGGAGGSEEGPAPAERRREERRGSGEGTGPTGHAGRDSGGKQSAGAADAKGTAKGGAAKGGESEGSPGSQEKGPLKGGSGSPGRVSEGGRQRTPELAGGAARGAGQGSGGLKTPDRPLGGGRHAGPKNGTPPRHPTGPVADSGTHEERLTEAARKLKERYNDIEMAKKQRTIQVVEPGDMAKGPGKPGPVRGNVNGRAALPGRGARR